MHTFYVLFAPRMNIFCEYRQPEGGHGECACWWHMSNTRSYICWESSKLVVMIQCSHVCCWHFCSVCTFSLSFSLSNLWWKVTLYHRVATVFYCFSSHTVCCTTRCWVGFSDDFCRNAPRSFPTPWNVCKPGCVNIWTYVKRTSTNMKWAKESPALSSKRLFNSAKTPAVSGTFGDL